MKNWTEKLNEEVFHRLCECRTIKADLQQLVNAKWESWKENGKADRGFTKEDALIVIMDLMEWNSCHFDLTADEYRELCK